MQIKSVRFRAILNSCGGIGIESELALLDGYQVVASSPRALSPGSREHKFSDTPARVGPIVLTDELRSLIDSLCNGSFVDQQCFDSHLNNFNKQAFVGADVLLSLSLAYGRACARAQGMGMFQYLSKQSSCAPSIPQPLINVISGGVHCPGGCIPVQQIMIFPRWGDVIENYADGIDLFASIERKLTHARCTGLSSSSGLIVHDLGLADALGLVKELISRYRDNRWTIGIDFAAEHLWNDKRQSYRWGKVQLDPEEMYRKILQLTEAYDLGLVEDPFHYSHPLQWKRLVAITGRNGRYIVGDDLFASRVRHVDSHHGCATAILLKLNQAQTISDAFRAAACARETGLTICASHRSCETNDVAICDFAASVGATLIKLGGPRRGDRVAKYNQMLRIADQLAR